MDDEKKRTKRRKLFRALLATGAVTGGLIGFAWMAGTHRVREIKRELRNNITPEGLADFVELRERIAEGTEGNREPVVLIPPPQIADADGKSPPKATNSDKPWEAFGLTEEQWRLMDGITREKLVGTLDFDLTQQDLEKIKKMFEQFGLTDEKIRAGLAITQGRVQAALKEWNLTLADFSPEDLKQLMLDDYTAVMGALLGHFGKFDKNDLKWQNVSGWETKTDAEKLSYFLDHLSPGERQAVIDKLFDDSKAGKAERFLFGLGYYDTLKAMLLPQARRYVPAASWLYDEGYGR